jgi:hypothetical protein
VNFSGYVKEGSEATYGLYLHIDGDTQVPDGLSHEATGNWVKKSGYGTIVGTPVVVLWQIASSGAGTTLLFDSVSVRQVTSPQATGAWLVNTPGGSVKNFESIESGFDPNDISSVIIQPGGQAEVEHVFELKYPRTDARWATFTLGASNPSNIRFPRNRIMKNQCRHKFKGSDGRCGYSGGETSCNKTLSRCRELNNSERFGGRPGVGYAGLKVS